MGTLDHSHWVIRSDQFWEVFENGKPVTGIISLRTGIETGAHLESIRKRALRLDKPDQAGVRSQIGRVRPVGRFGAF